MPRRPKPLLTFIQDSREQAPFRFGAPVRSEFTDGGTAIEGLESADYSARVDGELLSIRIERKSLGDLFGVCGFGRERFVRELERLREYDYRAIIVEATADQILHGYERSRIPGRSVMASLACWSVQFGIAVWFGETHRRAAGIAQRLLEEHAAHYLERMRRVDGERLESSDSDRSSQTLTGNSNPVAS